MYLLAGGVRFASPDGSVLSASAGDALFVPQGAPIGWESSERVAKFYVVPGTCQPEADDRNPSMSQPLRLTETSPKPPACADVVVIGGGIIGVFTAYYLAQRGMSVAVVEKGRIGAEQSSRNWGWCRQQTGTRANCPWPPRASSSGISLPPERRRHRFQALRLAVPQR